MRNNFTDKMNQEFTMPKLYERITFPFHPNTKCGKSVKSDRKHIKYCTGEVQYIDENIIVIKINKKHKLRIIRINDKTPFNIKKYDMLVQSYYRLGYGFA